MRTSPRLRAALAAMLLALAQCQGETPMQPPPPPPPPPPPASAGPTAPSNLVVQFVSSSRIDLRWVDNASDEDGYRLDRCAGTGCTSFTTLRTMPANFTATTDLGLEDSTTYRYRVQAFNAGGPSAFAGPVSATTLIAVAPPAAPSQFVATFVSLSRVELAWNDNATNEDEYDLERCTGAGCTAFVPFAITVANATSYQANAPLTAGTSYTYRLYARNGAGVSGALTATVVTPITPASPAIGLSATAATFTATQGGVSPASQTIQVTNAGGGTLTGIGGSITYAPGQATGWLSAQLGSTDAPTTLTLRATTGSRLPGTYNATVSVTATGASNSPRSIGVTFTVVAPTANPVISVSVSSRTFSATAGGSNPPSQQAQVGNAGTGTLSGLAVTENPPVSWLSVSLSSTTAPATITFQATTGTLAAGTYTTTVQVASPVASNSPQSVTVTFTVAPGQTPSTTVRIINDLPGTVSGPNDWGKLNTVIRVRVGPTQQSVVQFTSPARELLYPLDYTSDAGSTIDIAPGQEMTLDVSGFTTEYYLYVQTGWWEYNAYTDLWDKHVSVVVGCDGTSSAYKWTTIRITQPFFHPEPIRLSDFLPVGNWYASPFCP